MASLGRDYPHHLITSAHQPQLLSSAPKLASSLEADKPRVGTTGEHLRGRPQAGTSAEDLIR